MSEKMTEVFEEYDINVQSSYKGRGAIICLTDTGVYKVEPLSESIGRLKKEYTMKERLYEAGFINIDRHVLNKQGELFTYDRYHNPFVVKHYFEGRECNIQSEGELCLAVKNLAKLHLTGRKLKDLNTEQEEGKTLQNLQRHNRELKRVRSYIKGVSPKTEFEILYVSCYEYFYEQALRTFEALENWKLPENIERIGLCHGAYHHHNVLMCDGYEATINFEKFTFDNQLTDLYLLIRKAMEKNQYAYSLMDKMLQAYDKEIGLQQEDYIFLYFLFQYPEKFWKISNHYYNTKKSWIPPKTIEKLNGVISQENQKKQLLSAFRKGYGLHI